MAIRSLILTLLFLVSLLLSTACSKTSGFDHSQVEKSSTAIESASLTKHQRIGFVNDFAKVLSQEEVETLTARATDMLRANEVDIAIVTITSLGGEPIEKVTMGLARNWKVGTGKRGDGIVICLAIEDRQSRIDVTRGLEKRLPDEECSHMLKEARPLFARGEYSRGCESVLEAIREVLKR